MKKSDLRNKMAVKTREGKIYLVIDDVVISCDSYMHLVSYKEDLTHKHFSGLDIMEVVNSITILDQMKTKDLKLLWRRPWKPNLDEEYYLANLCSKDLYNHKFWLDTSDSAKWLERGLIFKTKEEAIECSKRLLKNLKEDK